MGDQFDRRTGKIPQFPQGTTASAQLRKKRSGQTAPAVTTSIFSLRIKPMKIKPVNDSPQKCLGLFTKKERWGLSWRGWLAVVILFLLGGYGVLASIHPFLAVTQRED